MIVTIGEATFSARDRNGYRRVPLKSNNLIRFQSTAGQYELASHDDHSLVNTVASNRERLSRCKSPRQVSIVLHSLFPRGGDQRARAVTSVADILELFHSDNV